MACHAVWQAAFPQNNWSSFFGAAYVTYALDIARSQVQIASAPIEIATCLMPRAKETDIALLRDLWRIALGTPEDDSAHRLYLEELLPASVARMLPDSSRIKIDEALDLAIGHNAADQALQATAEHFKRMWPSLDPAVKASVLQVARAFPHKALQGLSPLSERDARLSSIPWNVADILYVEEKNACFDQFQNWGVDLRRREMLGPLDHEKFLLHAPSQLSGLLRARIELDWVVVSLAAARDEKNSVLGKVTRRATEESAELISALTGALHTLAEASDSSHVQRSIPGHFAIEKHLIEPIRVKMKEVLQTVSEIEPPADRFRKVKEMYGGGIHHPPLTGTSQSSANNPASNDTDLYESLANWWKKHPLIFIPVAIGSFLVVLLVGTITLTEKIHPGSTDEWLKRNVPSYAEYWQKQDSQQKQPASTVNTNGQPKPPLNQSPFNSEKSTH